MSFATSEIPSLDEVTDLVFGTSSEPLSESIEVLSEYTVFEPSLSNEKSQEDDLTGPVEVIDVDIVEVDTDYESTVAQPYTFDLLYIIKKSAINLILPFINGMMLGFGEILAHEIGFRYNWIGARVQPVSRMQKRKLESKFL